MINICIENETACIYNIKDWEVLRKTYRIIGDPLGNNFSIPSLPVKLLPEEALLLKRKGHGKLIRHKEILNEPNNDDQTKYNEFKIKLCKAQKEMYRNIRKTAIEGNIEKIIAGKRKRGDTRSAEEIFEEELDKSCVLTEGSMLWPIFYENQHSLDGFHIEVPDDVLLKQTTQAKLCIYEDLWNRGYYISSGNKFGGDFLIYLGDPVLHHAVNIVRCVEETNKPFYPSELVALGRLGTSVKKKTLLGALKKDGNVRYLTLNWMES